WTHAYSIKLANFWAKHLDRLAILVHHHGKLDKVIHIFCSRELFPCVWIEKQIWFVAYRPEFDRMEGSMGISTCTQAAPGVIHIVYPLTCQFNSVFQRRRPLDILLAWTSELRLYHTLSTYL